MSFANLNRRTVAGLAKSVLAELDHGDAQASATDIEAFLLRQRAVMPDYLRFPFAALTLVFGLEGVIIGGAWFDRLPESRRLAQIKRWKASRLSFCRDFIRFHESLAIFLLYSRLLNSLTAEPPLDVDQHKNVPLTARG